MSLQVETFVAGPLSNNLYLLIDDAASEAVVIDPSIEGDAALERMRQWMSSGVRLSAIWITHGHLDHIYDNARWKSEFSAPILMHPDDAFWIERLREQSLWLGLPPPQIVRPDRWLQDGETLSVGSYGARVLYTPGHSPGSVTFVFEKDGFCISGDVLFRGSVGRTDLPGCSVAQLQQSLQKLFELPGDTRILPGHGEPTTIDFEMMNNPFCRQILKQDTK